MPDGTGILDFGKKFPGRMVDVGISEQVGVAMAAGMAQGGLRPVVAIYSSFMQRAYDIIFQEAVYASPSIDITDKVIKALSEAN